MAANKIEVVLALIDKATAPLQAFNQRISRITDPFRRINNHLQVLGQASGLGKIGGRINAVGDAAGNLAGKMAGIGAAGLGAGYLFKKGFVDVAAQFEKYSLILETLEGSAEKGKKAMSWISEFSQKTPYELEEVTEAFLYLRGAGIDPAAGTLKTLGDAAAATGKPVMQFAEAITDAMMGENERLKELFITAKKEGKKIVYEYEHNGKTIRAAANANNKRQIRATLETIWNQRYAGAMDKLSAGWGGITSNLADQWSRFALMVMNGGAFDFLKSRLSDALATLDKMAKSGELQRIADTFGKRLLDGLKSAWEAGKQIYGFFEGFIDAVGGVGNAMKIVAAIAAGPLMLAIVNLGTAIVSLGMALWATPFGWVAAAIAGVVVAGLVLWRNWEAITEFLTGAWETIRSTAAEKWGAVTESVNSSLDSARAKTTDAFEWIANTFEGFDAGAMAERTFGAIEEFIMGMWERIKGKFVDGMNFIGEKLEMLNPAKAAGKAWDWGASLFSDDASPKLGPAAGAAPATAAAMQSGQRTVTNNATVSVDFKNVPRGVEVTPAANNKASLDLSMGYSMATP